MEPSAAVHSLHTASFVAHHTPHVLDTHAMWKIVVDIRRRRDPETARHFYRSCNPNDIYIYGREVRSTLRPLHPYASYMMVRDLSGDQSRSMSREGKDAESGVDSRVLQKRGVYPDISSTRSL